MFLLKMTISTNPFRYLPKNLDFGLFYEAEEDEVDKIQQKHKELKDI